MDQLQAVLLAGWTAVIAGYDGSASFLVPHVNNNSVSYDGRPEIYPHPSHVLSDL